MVAPGEWHDPQDPGTWRSWGTASLQLPLRRDEDEIAAEQAVAALAGSVPGTEAYPLRRHGYPVQAHITGLPGGGSQVITRRTWRELLGKLTEVLRLPPFS